jgi:hypothetical protein
MAMVFTDRQTAFIEQGMSTIEASLEKDCDKIDIVMQEGTEQKSTISLDWEHADQLGNWLIARAKEMRLAQ